ncbi:MFS general substrate transporter, partial [Colletotrichum somersetense]
AAIDTGFSASTHAAVASAFNHANLASWPINAFLVASMTMQPLYGRSSDLLGRKIVYVTASSIFVIGLLGSAFSPAWWSLIAARALCGLGSAGITTMGSVLLTDTVGLARRGYYQSLNYAVYGGGSALSSAIGGSIVQNLGWDWVFKIQIPISMLALILLLSFIPHGMVPSNPVKPGESRVKVVLQRFDWLGSACLVLTLISLFVFLTIGGNLYKWSHPLVLFAALLTVTAAACFVLVERKAKVQILPLYLLIKFPACNFMLAGYLTSLINYTVLYNTTLFFQTVHLDTVQDAGFRLLIPSVSFTISSCFTGFLIARRKSPALTLRLGQSIVLCGAYGLVVMAAVSRRANVPDWMYDCMIALPILGVGMLASSTVMSLLNATPAADQAVANGTLIMMRSLGVFSATAFSTTILQNVFLESLGEASLDNKTIQVSP